MLTITTFQQPLFYRVPDISQKFKHFLDNISNCSIDCGDYKIYAIEEINEKVFDRLHYKLICYYEKIIAIINLFTYINLMKLK
jgi:hypothetical protein